MNWLAWTGLVLAGAVAVGAAGWFGAIARRAWQAAYRMYHPRDDAADTDRSSTDNSDAVRVRSGLDGTELAVAFVPGRGPHVVVVAHPIGQDRTWMTGHVRMLNQAGYHVVTYDQRNHGESGADPAAFGRARATYADLQEVIRFAAARPECAGGRAGLFAMSFTSWPAFGFAARPDLVDAVVCDSGPALDLAASFGRNIELRRRVLPPMVRREIPFRVFVAAFRFCALRMLGARDWPPPDAQVRVPVLIIAGERDPLVPVDELRATAGRYRRAQLWVAPRAKHNQALRGHPDEYAARVAAFFDEAFATVPAPASLRTGRDG
jgi:uncharacterized protein